MHPLTYVSALALFLAGGALVLQHTNHHGHTYCEMYLPELVSHYACGGAPKILYNNGNGLVVSESRGIRSLYFGGHVQTRMDTDGVSPTAYVPLVVDEVMNSMYRKKAASVVLLGSGGGAIATDLMRRCEGCDIVGVDHNKEVIRLCNRYFQQETERLSYVHMDAREYLLTRVPVGSTDVIINDAYMSIHHQEASYTVASNHMAQTHILPLAHSRLRAGGVYIVTIRCPSAGPHATPLFDLVRRLERRYRKVRYHTFEEGLSVLPQHHVIVALR